MKRYSLKEVKELEIDTIISVIYRGAINENFIYKGLAKIVKNNQLKLELKFLEFPWENHVYEYYWIRKNKTWILADGINDYKKVQLFISFFKYKVLTKYDFINESV